MSSKWSLEAKSVRRMKMVSSIVRCNVEAFLQRRWSLKMKMKWCYVVCLPACPASPKLKRPRRGWLLSPFTNRTQFQARRLLPSRYWGQVQFCHTAGWYLRWPPLFLQSTTLFWCLPSWKFFRKLRIEWCAGFWTLNNVRLETHDEICLSLYHFFSTSAASSFLLVLTD